MISPVIRPDVVERVVQRRGRPHSIERLDASKTALIVIDMQNYFVEQGAPVEVPSARDIVPGINQMAAAARSAGSPVVWIQTTHDETDLESWSVFFERHESAERSRSDLDGLRDGSHLHAIFGGLETSPEDLWVSKRRYSAFLPESSDLARILRERQIENVIITGTVTNVCCLTSALDAMMMNFRLIMVADANAGLIEEHHLAVFNNIFEVFGDVRTTEETIELLRDGSPQSL